MDDDELGAAEEARDRRRDRRSEAHERDLMRTGSAKVFKQILDAQAKRALADEDEGAEDEDEGAEPRTPDRSRHDHHRHHGHGDARDR